MSNQHAKTIADLYASDLPHRAVTVWQYLKSRADNDTASCFPAVRTIAKDMKISARTVQRAVNDLISAGYLRREFRMRKHNAGQSSNLYTLL